MSPWLFNVYMDEAMKEVNENGGAEDRSKVSGGGREWRLPGLLYADVLVLCGNSKDNLKVMVIHFVEICRRRGLKVTADKSMRKEWSVKSIDRARLEQFSDFKYFGCVLD